MSIEIFCEECGAEIDAGDTICRDCYNGLNEELKELQDTIDEQGKLIEDLENEIREHGEHEKP